MVNPITTVPAVILGGYNKMNRRNVWLEYAQEGDVYAQWELANSYCCNDFEGNTNSTEAIKWFCTAAEEGYSKAQVVIGKLYENTLSFDGVTVAKNDINAYIWFELAARRINEDGIQHKKFLKDKLTADDKQRISIILEDVSNLSCKAILD